MVRHIETFRTRRVWKILEGLENTTHTVRHVETFKTRSVRKILKGLRENQTHMEGFREILEEFRIVLKILLEQYEKF